ncbi:3-carboxy-cis,cis-muconate cycloisomerase, putative [Sulfitobacter indolifex HEL-45]|uniref:3-carboxy-cis,cis-muconate cycloisomerase, putative n=2 Tax=Sulfitobacter indolifex TaxID=225422 RepID=A0ABP2D4A3_9RHOB|nr:3-carboxy-cis,cis-muconate cycloisomerase, putative [Sulfitobacter indolifex HEL-45]
MRAILLVTGALAKVQGVIPELSAPAIHRASLENRIEPKARAKATSHNGVSVPALIDRFRAELQAPKPAQYVPWGATSQYTIDTALVPHLRQAPADALAFATRADHI